MALDFQKTVYTNYTQRPDTRLTRTSYGNMNRWRQHPEVFGTITRCDLVQELDEREVRRLLLSQMKQRVAVSEGRLNQQGKHKYPTWERTRSGQQMVPTSSGGKYANVVPYIPTPGKPGYDMGVPELPRIGPKSSHGSMIPHDPNHPVHLGYYKSGGYDDAHKASIKLMEKGVFPAAMNGPRLLRAGRMGASWRHTKEVMQAMGKRHVFIDGVVTQDDISRMKSILSPNDLPTSSDYGSQENRTERVKPIGNQKPQNFTSMTVLHDPTVQKGTEKNNWLIMR